jgi:hypothetical protein
LVLARVIITMICHHPSPSRVTLFVRVPVHAPSHAPVFSHASNANAAILDCRPGPGCWCCCRWTKRAPNLLDDTDSHHTAKTTVPNNMAAFSIFPSPFSYTLISCNGLAARTPTAYPATTVLPNYLLFPTVAVLK